MTTHNIHGISFCIDDYGIAVIGESGLGKSDFALKLIERGHKFIADDHIKLSLIDDNLHIQAHDKLNGFIHIRDIGFIDVKATYGNHSLIAKHKLNLIIELIKDNWFPGHACPSTEIINSSFYYVEILGQQVPMIKLNIGQNRPLELLIELAVKCRQQLDNEYNANQNFIEKQQLAIFGDMDSRIPKNSQLDMDPVLSMG
jgi:HPr kinase/phosphorylase